MGVKKVKFDNDILKLGVIVQNYVKFQYLNKKNQV